MLGISLYTSCNEIAERIICDTYKKAFVMVRDISAPVTDDVDIIILSHQCSDGSFEEAKKYYTPDCIFKIIENKNDYELVDYCGNFVKDVTELLQRRFDRDFIAHNIFPGKSDIAKLINKQIRTAACNDKIVLIVGPTGAGKTLVSKLIHNLSKCKKHNNEPLLVNCDYLSDELFTSQLFGVIAGAYTGAVKMDGYLDTASNNTVVFDDIADLSLKAQGTFLTLTEEKRFMAVGSSKVKKCTSRLIFITNKNLSILVKEKKFRQDLLYRIDANIICIPPLSERKEDIPVIVNYFLRDTNKSLSSAAWNKLLDHEWTGNTRELRMVLENAVENAKGEEIDEWDIKFLDNYFKVLDINLNPIKKI